MSRPSYFAIIPASVRYADINSSAKLLYGEITALSNQEGYCYAANKYFAELYGVDTRTISRWLDELLKINEIYITNPKSKYRKIYIDKNVQVNSTRTKVSNSLRQNCPSNLDNNVQHNTKTNNTNNTSTTVDNFYEYKGFYWNQSLFTQQDTHKVLKSINKQSISRDLAQRVIDETVGMTIAKNSTVRSPIAVLLGLLDRAKNDQCKFTHFSQSIAESRSQYLKNKSRIQEEVSNLNQKLPYVKSRAIT